MNHAKVEALTPRLRHAGEPKRTWSLTVLKRQDPSLIRGMVTVGKELPTHFNTGKAIFFGLLTGIIPSQEVEAPCTRG